MNDVYAKFEDHLNSENSDELPKLHALIRNLTTIDKKSIQYKNYCYCNLCNMRLDISQYKIHYVRCSSVDYICNMAKKYFDKNLNRKKLMSVAEVDFEQYYWSFCEKLYDKMEDGLQKHTLKNAILTHNNLPPEADLNQILESI